MIFGLYIAFMHIVIFRFLLFFHLLHEQILDLKEEFPNFETGTDSRNPVILSDYIVFKKSDLSRKLITVEYI